jgi:hypothetical protein
LAEIVEALRGALLVLAGNSEIGARNKMNLALMCAPFSKSVCASKPTAFPYFSDLAMAVHYVSNLVRANWGQRAVLNQLTLNMLQLAYLSRERMAALTALLSLAGHCSEALRAHLDRWRCIAVALC